MRKQHFKHRRLSLLGLLALSAVAVTSAAYLGGRALQDSDPTAHAQSEPEFPGPDVTPAPGQSPDTSQPFWYSPYLNEDRMKPRYDQVVNGILVGPNVTHEGTSPCAPGQARTVDESVADGTPLEIPTHPDHGQLQRHDTTVCGDLVVAHEVEYYEEPEPNLDSRLSSGQVRWEDSKHGSTLAIYRRLTTSPLWNSGIAADRWHAGSIKGRPAAIGMPIHEIGLGLSTIVIWDAQTGVQCTLVATNLTIGQLTAIAEGLY